MKYQIELVILENLTLTYFTEKKIEQGKMYVQIIYISDSKIDIDGNFNKLNLNFT